MRQFAFMLLFVASLLISSCNQKELGYWADPSHLASLRIKANYLMPWEIMFAGGPNWHELWNDKEYMMTYESLYPTEPEGLRVMAYHVSGKWDEFNLEPHGGQLNVSLGKHTLLLYNNDTEYIVFDDIKDPQKAKATTSVGMRSSYVGSPFVSPATNDNVINQPDMLYACNGGEIEALDIEDELAGEYQLKPLVYKYLVRYHFIKGINHVTYARGILAGMAASVYLCDGHTSDETATLVYDMNLHNKRLENAEKGEGMLYAVVSTFGAPSCTNEYYSRAGQNPCGLSLQVQLTNGNMLSFDYDITDLVDKQPRGGVLDVYGLQITDEDAAEGVGEGSFDVNVNGWGDNIEVPIM